MNIVLHRIMSMDVCDLNQNKKSNKQEINLNYWMTDHLYEMPFHKKRGVYATPQV